MFQWTPYSTEKWSEAKLLRWSLRCKWNSKCCTDAAAVWKSEDVFQATGISSGFDSLLVVL